MDLTGRWRGWYAHGFDGLHHPMEMRIEAADGRLRGGGMDDVGAFTISGSGGPDRLTWLKRYATHSVNYFGERDGSFIRGTWKLDGFSGTFCLWPDGFEAGDAAVEARPEAAPKSAAR